MYIMYNLLANIYIYIYIRTIAYAILKNNTSVVIKEYVYFARYKPCIGAASINSIYPSKERLWCYVILTYF